MKVRLFLAVLVALLPLSLTLPGCSGGTAPEQASAEAPAAPANGARQFGVVYQTMNNPFFVELNEGLREVVEAHGDTLVALDSQFNSLKQKNDISDLILKNVAALFINPVNWEGIKGSLLQASEKGVPSVIIDAPVRDADLVLCQVASDNIEAGRLAARALAQVRPQAKIVILHHSVNKACIDRVAGFEEELAKHPEMRVLDTQEGKGTTEGGRPVMRDLLARFPEIDGVFAINDPSALGALSAIESAGKLDAITVVTVDGSQEGIGAINAGRLHSSSAQFPREIGRLAAEKAYAHLEGKPVEKDVKVRVELITKENAGQFLVK